MLESLYICLGPKISMVDEVFVLNLDLLTLAELSRASHKSSGATFALVDQLSSGASASATLRKI